jgi:hypothetical protein
MHHASDVGLVRFACAQRRFGVVVQERFRPLAKRHLLALADDLEDVAVSSLKSIA